MLHTLPLVLGLLAPAATPVSGGPFLEISFEEALKRAKQEEKFVFIDFYATWCAPCLRLDRLTWSNPKVAAWLSEETVPLKIDAEIETALARRYEVGAYPTLLFIKPDGEIQGWMVGFKDPSDFLKEGRDIVAGVRKSDRLRRLHEKDPEDPNLRLKLGRQLEMERSYEEATGHYLWCWDHGVQDPARGFEELRRTILLSDIGRLARLYPPMLKALNERRDRLLLEVSGPRPTRAGARDLAALYETLGQRAETLALYDRLRARPAPEAGAEAEGAVPAADPCRVLFPEVVDLLLAAGRYADAVAGYGEPLAWLDGRWQEYEHARASQQGGSELLDQQAMDLLRRQALEDGAQLYEALAGTRENDDQAAAAASRLASFSEGPRPWIELMAAARRADRKDLQQALRDEALRTLPLIHHRRIPRVKDRKGRR